MSILNNKNALQARKNALFYKKLKLKKNSY